MRAALSPHRPPATYRRHRVEDCIVASRTPPSAGDPKHKTLILKALKTPISTVAANENAPAIAASKPTGCRCPSAEAATSRMEPWTKWQKVRKSPRSARMSAAFSCGSHACAKRGQKDRPGLRGGRCGLASATFGV
ncbi:hypothetical protein FHT86_005597 [Rhizobium sp. BK313]|nr:hypothetical protein [Rhizobium sp. BK313]